jgi:hypothetical protein
MGRPWYILIPLLHTSFRTIDIPLYYTPSTLLHVNLYFTIVIKTIIIIIIHCVYYKKLTSSTKASDGSVQRHNQGAVLE